MSSAEWHAKVMAEKKRKQEIGFSENLIRQGGIKTDDNTAKEYAIFMKNKIKEIRKQLKEK